MKTQTASKVDPKLTYAAQNAKLGLICVADLSLLTGVEVARLSSFAKKGFLGHYGEYHGKRFFNFEEIVNWVNEPGAQDEAQVTIKTTMQTVLQNDDCPYSLRIHPKNSNQTPRVQILWKDTNEQ